MKRKSGWVFHVLVRSADINQCLAVWYVDSLKVIQQVSLITKFALRTNCASTVATAVVLAGLYALF